MVNKDAFVSFRGDRPRRSLLDPAMILRELYCSVVMKRVLSKTAKVSAFKSVLVPILTCAHES